MSFLRKIFDSEYKELCRFEKLADQIISLEPEMEKLKMKTLLKKRKNIKKK